MAGSLNRLEPAGMAKYLMNTQNNNYALSFVLNAYAEHSNSFAACSSTHKLRRCFRITPGIPPGFHADILDTVGIYPVAEDDTKLEETVGSTNAAPITEITSKNLT